MNEKDIIQKYFTKAINEQSVIAGIGDDAAIVSVSSGCELVMTTDTMLEGKHFSKQAPAYAVGYKLMASNLSDIAAMGAAPRWAMLNLTLSSLDQSWLKGFSKGLLECAQAHNVVLIGGDTTSGDCLNVSVQLIGEVPISKAMLRSNAQVNDKIYVTGIIGNAASALRHLQQKKFNHHNLSAAQYCALYMPDSRINLAIELREIANAAIDISDGLLNELEIVCNTSGTGAKLQLDKIPLAKEISTENAITGGEDYELLFTIPDKYTDQISLLAHKHDCLISQIGEITNNNVVDIYEYNRSIPHPKRSGYDHFAK